MRKSRLESYQDILEVLVNDPLTLDHLAYKINIDCTVLRQHLNFLTENGLVEERASDKKKLHAITEKGTAVLKALSFQKYLRRISDKITVIDEALDIIRKLEKSER